ncbi:uncharacterized protein [Fopius arisanus]|uniref:Uncharacterized protein n=1 Tax=Fopius arisanus TaxID=64838 RepID=A0A9R1TTF2_9HYME|nr:PREDICTED: uncharacterized protein LOC105274220 [Fopius arisanus]
MQAASIAFEEKFLGSIGPTRDGLPNGVSKVLEYNTPFLPSSLRISNYDYAKAKEVDNFYKIVQLHREQYKIMENTSHPLSYFKTYDTDNPTKSYFIKYPVTHVKYKNPLVLPRTYGRTIKLPSLPQRRNSGIHNRFPCTAYKF